MKSVFRRKNFPAITLIIILLTNLYTIGYFHRWKKNEDGTRGVIRWDVISYYGYLPAAVIHGDVSLDFLDEGKVKNDNKFWYVKLENGNRLIVTTMGLSFLYAPFFFIAHALAPLVDQARDGYSNIYQLMLVVSGLFYAFMGLILLARFLRKHFDPLITAIVILAVGLGTNLYYYSSLEAAMPHSHNFFLITVFMTMVVLWYRNHHWYHGVTVGFLFGLIVLIRPTNVLLFLFFFLYGVTSWKKLWERVVFYVSKWHMVLIMIAAFLIPWIPQLLYWKEITGQYLFYTYGEKNARFYFTHPHILESLFHIRKGWLVYTPVMAFALAGIPLLYRRSKEWFFALLFYVIAMIYAQSSWWCWWFGGGFGLRPYISMYPLLAFPMAVLLKALQDRRKRTGFTIVTSVIVLLVAYQIFQTRQFTTQAIHYSATTTESYCENFMRTYPTGPSWKMLEVPDFNLARLGIYVTYPTSEDKETWRNMEKAEAYARIREEINTDRQVKRQIRRYAEREDIPVASAMQEVMDRMYYRKTN